jgi:hypothetical protein
MNYLSIVVMEEEQKDASDCIELKETIADLMLKKQSITGEDPKNRKSASTM